MRPLRTRLQEARRHLGIPWEALERDYLLSWILAGISRTPVLRDTLVFKGGTALRKCYFGDYRFSEDLDFSTLKGIPTGNEMEEVGKEKCAEPPCDYWTNSLLWRSLVSVTRRGNPIQAVRKHSPSERDFRGIAAYRPASW